MTHIRNQSLESSQAKPSQAKPSVAVRRQLRAPSFLHKFDPCSWFHHPGRQKDVTIALLLLLFGSFFLILVILTSHSLFSISSSLFHQVCVYIIHKSANQNISQSFPTSMVACPQSKCPIFFPVSIPFLPFQLTQAPTRSVLKRLRSQSQTYRRLVRPQMPT